MLFDLQELAMDLFEARLIPDMVSSYKSIQRLTTEHGIYTKEYGDDTEFRANSQSAAGSKNLEMLS